jgi:hypothetical protein
MCPKGKKLWAGEGEGKGKREQQTREERKEISTK